MYTLIGFFAWKRFFLQKYKYQFHSRKHTHGTVKIKYRYTSTMCKGQEFSSFIDKF